MDKKLYVKLLRKLKKLPLKNWEEYTNSSYRISLDEVFTVEIDLCKNVLSSDIIRDYHLSIYKNGHMVNKRVGRDNQIMMLYSDIEDEFRRRPLRDLEKIL